LGKKTGSVTLFFCHYPNIRISNENIYTTENIYISHLLKAKNKLPGEKKMKATYTKFLHDIIMNYQIWKHTIWINHE